MSKEELLETMLALVKSAMYENTEFTKACYGTDWKLLFKMAKKNKLIPFLIDRVKGLKDTCDIPEELYLSWQNTAMGSMLYECEKYRALKQILEKGEEEGITCILIKGAVIAGAYPKHLSRVSSDADILVYPKDKEEAIRLFKELGYRKDEENSKNLVYVYVLDSLPFKVELHFSLWEDYQSPKITLLDNMNLVRKEALIKIDTCGLKVVTLGHQEHFIFQIFHIIKHFSLEGVSIRYLIDITFYLRKYGDYIDYKDFWGKMDYLNYGLFCENFFSICINYLNMPADILEGRSLFLNSDTQAFLWDMIQVGSFYEEKSSAWQIIGIMTPYFLGEQKIPKTEFGRKLKILFPASKDLPGEYAYAKKYSYLLPIAWIHKNGYFLIKWARNRKDWYDVKEKLTVAEHRLYLMQSLGLIDGGRTDDKTNK